MQLLQTVPGFPIPLSGNTLMGYRLKKGAALTLIYRLFRDLSKY
jgi:hypothetical protein